MSPARFNAVVFAASTVLAVALVWRRAQRPPPRSLEHQSPLSAIPQGAMLVATLDTNKLQGTRLGAALLAERGELPGLGPIVDICGFDPTLQIGMLTFAVPAVQAGNGEEASIEFGVAGYGDFSSEQVAACASTSIQHRGRSAVTTRVGSFTSIRQRQGSEGEIAVRSGGPVLLGGGRYLREMIDAADGRVPSANRDERHRALRTSLGEDATLLVTWLPPRGWLESLLESDLASLSPLAAVDRAALRIDAGPRLLVTLHVGCDNADTCKDLAEVMEGLVEGELDPLLEQELPSAKQRFAVTAGAGQVRVTVWLDESEAIQLVSRVLERLRALPPASAGTHGAPALIPDEVLTPPASSR